MKVALVVGSAPCLHKDVKEALEMYPLAYVCAVNGACVALEKLDAVVAGHTNKAMKFAAARRNAFPDCDRFEVLANEGREGQYSRAEYRCVTRWFDRSVSTGATSAAKAARMMLQMDFDRVILCGCPLDATGYFEGESQKGLTIGHDCRRVGDPEQDAHRTIVGYRQKFKKLAEGEFKGRVFSMSGLTRRLLGAPPAV